MLALYAISAIVVFLVATWFLRHRLRPADLVVPRAWRISGWLVWASLFLGGFTGVGSLLRPALGSLPTSVADIVGGALFGLVVALVVWIGASLAFYADVQVWRWAVLYQVVALAGDVFASAGAGGVSYAIVTVVPFAGLLALAFAFRTPPSPTAPEAPARRKR